MNLEIRRADVSDAATIALLGRITFAESFGHLFQEHAEDLRTYLDRTFAVGKIRGSLEQPCNAYWLGSVDGLPVSYAKLKYPSAPSATPVADRSDISQLQKIYVLREFSGRGIGQPLLHEVLRHADTLQAAAVWLDVLEENIRAVQFYERHGFRALGNDTYTIGAQTFAFLLMTKP